MAEYNGWKSYETWLVSIWFGDVLADLASEYGSDFDASMIQNFVEEMLQTEGNLPETGFAADIMNAALRNVDWDDLYNHYAPEEEPDDDGQPDEGQEWESFDPDC